MPRFWRPSSLACLILGMASLGAAAQDYLEPEMGIMYAPSTSYDYCQNINELFFKDARDRYLARMFCRPGFSKPQWCVTVSGDAERGYRAEAVAAERQITPDKASLAIPVRRSSRPIDAETALAVEAVFRRMLREVRYPDRDGKGDADEFGFARNVGGWAPFVQPGDLPPGSEQGLAFDAEPGSRVDRLVQLGKALRRFAIAEAGDVEPIRAEIRRRARELDDRPAAPHEPSEKTPR